MVKLSLISSRYLLGKNIGNETILKEYKEFFLRKPLTLYDISDLKIGLINSKTQRYTYDSVIYYINKYFNRYLLSLTNISKKFLPKLLDQTHSKFYIGISDNGLITGIPLLPHQVTDLKLYIKSFVIDYYDNIMGLHYNKGNNKIIINNEIYYNYDKLVNILKKHTKINIHILNNQNNKNNICESLINKIKVCEEEENQYKKKLNEYNKLKKIKCDYNNKYSQAFHKLIRSDVMDEFKEYTSIPHNKFNNLLQILHDKIRNHNDVEKYLKNGLYIEKSLFSSNKLLDNEYGGYMKLYLEEYKNFKCQQLSKNILIEAFHQKNPIKKINPLLKNISCFNEYLDIDYYLIEIEIPFIKDKNVFIASKKDKKILQRGFMDMPYTI